MKKFYLALVLLCSPIISFAVDCTNPNSFYAVIPGVTPNYYCGYTNVRDPANLTICFEAAHGDLLFQNVSNCQTLTGAPINSGLIFLVIAGGGLGVYTISRKKSTDNLNVINEEA